jgi:Histidine kinase/Histidine kinase-, DNA gyrase B-, and HSP90-like ATPase
MHPILAWGGRLALYLGFWIFVGVLLAELLVTQVGFGWQQASLVALPLALAYAFVCLSAWYVSWSMPLAATGAPRIVFTALTASIISSSVWLVAARVWMQILVRHGWLTYPPRGTAGVYTLVLGFGFLLYLLSLAVSYLLAAFEQSREAERRALRGQVLAREAELRLLRAQIDPHFLFNSLHSISALTGSDPSAARRMCLLLADFLRESLVLGAQDRITLDRELGLIERFLAVERVRFGERLAGDIKAEDGAGACFVPPLILQPLVENAVTHGVAHVLEGGTVTVRASRTPGRLTIAIENPADRDRPRSRGTGMGLANVRARLTASYGGEARVDASEQSGVWRVELSLPATTEST